MSQDQRAIFLPALSGPPRLQVQPPMLVWPMGGLGGAVFRMKVESKVLNISVDKRTIYKWIPMVDCVEFIPVSISDSFCIFLLTHQVDSTGRVIHLPASHHASRPLRLGVLQSFFDPTERWGQQSAEPFTPPHLFETKKTSVCVDRIEMQ